jgi:hypothetical protein
MIVPVETSLINNKVFRGVLAVGLITALVSIILRGVVTFNGNNCIYDSFCSYSYYNNNLCIQGNSYYCCGTAGSSTCGSYSKCYYEGTYSSIMYCTGLVTAFWVLDGIAILTLIVMIVMACQQKKRVIANPLLPPGGAVGGQY